MSRPVDILASQAPIPRIWAIALTGSSLIGTVFQRLILISDAAARVSRDLIDVSYTLGAPRTQVVWRVLVPACLPGIPDSLRVISIGVAWAYLVVAELVAADAGLGVMIINGMRAFDVDVIFLAILVIGGLGLATDLAFAWVRRRVAPWASAA